MSLIDTNWNYDVDLISKENECCVEFQERVNSINERVVEVLENSYKNLKAETCNVQDYDSELKSLLETNKQLKKQLDIKLEEFTRNQKQYDAYKHDRELLSQEIKETHEAFLMAKKYYKKYLKIYYTIESSDENTQTVFVQFFTESKKENSNYAVRFSRDLKTAKYELLEMKPSVRIFSDIKKKLKETQDVPAALYTIRQQFLKLKKNK